MIIKNTDMNWLWRAITSHLNLKSTSTFGGEISIVLVKKRNVAFDAMILVVVWKNCCYSFNYFHFAGLIVSFFQVVVGRKILKAKIICAGKNIGR